MCNDRNQGDIKVASVGMGGLGMTAEERASVEAFKRDVIDPSMNALVVLDFWAEWCGPCKTLMPILEKVTAEFAPQVVLAKVNVDENRLIAEQFRVQSIPTVYAIFQGQPVYDLTPARTERELRHYLEQLLKQLPIEAAPADEQAVDIEALITMGEEVLSGGDAERALGIFSQIKELAPDNATAAAGLARSLIALGRADEATETLAAISPEHLTEAPVVRAQAALSLAKDAVPVADFAGLVAHVEQNPDMHEKRYELAGAHMARGDRDAAADALLEIIRRDRAWNEGAARDRLLKMFDAIGVDDPWTLAQRRKLSAILFS